MALRIPLFPLGMVLFPGVTVPLHLFEPRYRQMLVDVRDGDRRFGMVCGIPGVPEAELPQGRAGCVAEITHISLYPDGRADIVVTGRERFVFTQLLEDEAPYHVAEVEPLPDATDTTTMALMLSADDVASRFQRVVAAVRTLNDDTREPPPLPDDPAQIAYRIASMIDLDLEEQQALLAERSPAARLTRVDAVLRRVLPDLEIRSAMHRGPAK